jgi:hypothetical protein
MLEAKLVSKNNLLRDMDFVFLLPDEKSHNSKYSPPGKILAKLDGAELQFIASDYA